MREQAHRQASNCRGPAAQVTAARAALRDNPNGGLYLHPSSGQGVAPSTSREGSQVGVITVEPLNASSPPTTNGVDRLYCQLAEIHTITAAH
jgi:hypothetical protein